MLSPTKFDAKNPQKPDLKAEPWGTVEQIELDIPGSNGQTAKVTIRMSLLPKEWRAYKGAGGTSFVKERHIDDNEGVSILRADREVLYGTVPYIIGKKGQARPLDIDRFWGCEISFPPELDSYFQVRYFPRVAQRGVTQKAPDWEMAGEPPPPSLVRTAPLTAVSRGSQGLCRLPIVPLPPFALPDQHLPSQALIKPPGPCLLIFWEHRKDQMRSSSQVMPSHRLAH
jgi:hypothetical protein